MPWIKIAEPEPLWPNEILMNIPYNFTPKVKKKYGKIKLAKPIGARPRKLRQYTKV